MSDSDDDEAKPLVPRRLSPRTLPKDLSALHFVRLFASIHIFFVHTLTPPEFSATSGGQWGRSWVPFFFMLSGLGVAHSRLLELSNPKDDATARPSGTNKPEPPTPLLPTASTLLRRAASVYPTHVLGVLLDVFNHVHRGESIHFGTLIAELLLVFAWLPTFVFIGDQPPGHEFIVYAYNLPSWFVSVLAFYWLLEPASYALATVLWRANLGLASTALSRHFALLRLSVLWIAWVVCWPWCRFPLTWGNTSWTCIEILSYLHLYLYGMLLAFYLHDRAKRGVPPSRSLASLSAALLLLVFCVDLKWISAKMPSDTIDLWFCKTDLLMPLHCMLVIGLSEGADPLARVLSYGYLPVISRNLALGVYLLQTPVNQAPWQEWLGRIQTVSFGLRRPLKSIEAALKLILVLCAAALCHTLVQAPGSRLMMRIETRL